MNNNNRLFTLFLLLLAFPLALQAQVVTLTGKDFPPLLGKQNGLMGSIFLTQYLATGAVFTLIALLLTRSGKSFCR